MLWYDGKGSLLFLHERAFQGHLYEVAKCLTKTVHVLDPLNFFYLFAQHERVIYSLDARNHSLISQ